ncbi:DUF5915 domain-containing protein, partial [Methanobacterium aggregans]|uniref:DUF5915 domain-containing protein n=1 Tax=Methanobacterium aggregans TaxID=1615586 RepID=UPI00320C0EC1
FNEELIDLELEGNMDVVREIIEACAHARDVARYKLRWPVREVIIVSEDKKVVNAAQSLREVIMEQANTKNIVFLSEFENMTVHAQPNMKTLGPRLRGDVPKVREKLAEADGSVIIQKLESNGVYTVELEDKSIELSSEDIVFETELPENIESAEFDGGSIFIDTELTEEILSEAMSRELIRRVQDMRKDQDLDVEANIEVYVECGPDFQALLENFLDFISNEIRADKFVFGSENEGYRKEWKIEDYEVTVTIKKS